MKGYYGFRRDLVLTAIASSDTNHPRLLTSGTNEDVGPLRRCANPDGYTEDH